MSKPNLYGSAYSVYVRAARMALAEKGVSYNLVEVDVFAPDGPPVEHLARQPFGKIPAFEHDGFEVYETSAITRYIDEAFNGPALQPAAPQVRARMNQALGILDHHVYPDLVWGIYVAYKDGRDLGGVEGPVLEGAARAEVCLRALERLVPEGRWLAGSDLTLADLHAAPMFDLYLKTSEGADLLAPYPRLRSWWPAISARKSFAVTAF